MTSPILNLEELHVACTVLRGGEKSHTPKAQKRFPFFFFFPFLFEKRQNRNLVVKKSKSGGPIPLI